MRILLSNHTPIYGSGSGTYTAMLAEGLVRAGHEVCILTPSPEQSHWRSTIQRFSVKILGNFPSFTGHPLSSTTYSDLDPGELSSLISAWKDALLDVRYQWEPDIVHIQHVWVVAKAASSIGLRPVVTCHGSEANFAKHHPAIAKFLLPEPSQLGPVINISNFVDKSAHFIIRAAPFSTTISNPYDGQIFYYEPPKKARFADFPHLGFVGRLVAYKNCEQYLECVAYLKDNFPNLKASIIGDGPHRSYLEKLSYELNISEIVNFFGHLEQRRLRYHYQSFDALIVCSKNEPFGLVVLEAVACGTPAIVARSGGLGELINPPFVFGYERNDMNELVTKVIQALRNSNDPEFGNYANNYVEQRYSLTRYVKRLESIYDRELKEN